MTMEVSQSAQEKQLFQLELKRNQSVLYEEAIKTADKFFEITILTKNDE